MTVPSRLETGQGAAAVGVAAVFCSVVGLQLGWMATELLDWGTFPAVLLAGGGIGLGFWLGSRRNRFFERR